MNTLRDAAQQALDALEEYQAKGAPFWACDAAVAALRAALAEPQPQPEPVAWMVYTEGGTSAYVTDNPNDLVGAYRALPLYTHPPQRQHDEIVRLKAERDALLVERDALLAAAEKGTEYVLAQINQDLRAERDALQATLDDYMDDHKAVVNQQCAGDEVHCSCVPHLRKRIKEVEAERDAAVAVLETVLRIPSMSDADLEQLRINCKAAIDAARGEN